MRALPGGSATHQELPRSAPSADYPHSLQPDQPAGPALPSLARSSPSLPVRAVGGSSLARKLHFSLGRRPLSALKPLPSLEREQCEPPPLALWPRTIARPPAASRAPAALTRELALEIGANQRY